MCLDQRVTLVGFRSAEFVEAGAVIGDRIEVSEITEALNALLRPAGPGSYETICAL
jgi:hypothetical protein